jgi:acyl-coenzyme A thioesterase PaaI-like protein
MKTRPIPEPLLAHPTADAAASAALTELHRECFACGDGSGAGLNLRFAPDADGAATALWVPSPQFKSYPDRVHGGIIATLLDSAIVHALVYRGVTGVTAELTLRYLHSVNLEDAVRLVGWVESSKLGMFLCRAELYQREVLAVRASAKFIAQSFSAPDASRASRS